ncbi:hypothetical protein NIIDNTM18_29320 [Mycolicibacterium litorale]|uniref:Uncharacterized protein n=1 Tax=Mycolicibacterium litorale TaxID=758802 RepID=A0A6S6P4R0_9MYCO|nr:hypothetical protein [Mycolicibacterium litorale]BCI53654.1 hypothetical protein NIIDNTM18_29320 [Mycolicibacterium litorale]
MSNGRPYDFSPAQESAREWQKLQVGVLGFVGLCGVFSGGATSGTRPPWLQEVGAVAALSGLVLTLVGVLLVATVAHPVTRRPISPAAESRRLVVGIVTTFAAVALTALAALTWWWPNARADTPASAPKVAVTTSAGFACGTLEQIGPATLSLDVRGERVTVPLRAIVSSDVVQSC